MGRASRHSPEVRERAVRMVLEHQAEYASQWAAMESIGAKIGCTAETLRKWASWAHESDSSGRWCYTDRNVENGPPDAPASQSPRARRVARDSTMEKTLQVLNELERVGVLTRYAIGGAMGVTFYVEPILTFDLDVFVVLPRTGAGVLTLAPLYEALRTRGYNEEGECVTIEGVPVQFLPAYNALLEEALAEAKEILYETTRTCVLRAEHLMAIALQTGRDKDRQRARLLREQAPLDLDYLAAVLARHGLEAKSQQWNP